MRGSELRRLLVEINLLLILSFACILNGFHLPVELSRYFVETKALAPR